MVWGGDKNLLPFGVVVLSETNFYTGRRVIESSNAKVNKPAETNSKCTQFFIDFKVLY